MKQRAAVKYPKIKPMKQPTRIQNAQDLKKLVAFWAPF